MSPIKASKLRPGDWVQLPVSPEHGLPAGTYEAVVLGDPQPHPALSTYVRVDVSIEGKTYRDFALPGWMQLRRLQPKALTR